MQIDNFPVSKLKNAPIKGNFVLGDSGIENKVVNKQLHRPQLALTGYVELFNHVSIQIFGNTEINYLRTLSIDEQKESFSKICDFDVPCIVVTNKHSLPDELLEIASEKEVSVIYTKYETTKASAYLSEFLDDQFVERASVHGSFVDVYGVGMLFIGRSGIGKSEIALDLVERGHRLVADDVVLLSKKGETTLMGTGTSLVQHFMEIRGLGIIDVRQMFGIRSIRFQKRLEIVVQLEEWNEDGEYTRTGLDNEHGELMGVEINTIKLPIIAGKNITVIAEVIALNYLLKTYGYDAAEVLQSKLEEKLKMKGSNDRIIDYFQGDYE
jgi:HPr kinase/phosphorylase